MTPAGTVDLTRSVRETETTAKEPYLTPLPGFPRLAKIHGQVDLGHAQSTE